MKKKLGILLFGNFLVGVTNAETSVLNQNFGFYNGSDFDFKNGNCDTCIDKSAKFYFKDETFIVHKTSKNNGIPFFVWNNSSVFSEGVLSSDGKKFSDGKNKVNFEVAPKIPSNLSYYNDSSIDYFSGKPLIVKGEMQKNKFVANSFWLKEYGIPNDLRVQTLGNLTISDLIRRDDGNKVVKQLLWSKDNKPVNLQNKNTLTFILNGAQGDDDEAHGGHFAVATGKTDSNGQWNNLLVNNFYGLNSFSEKGIIASRVPLDVYQGDLNSGQSWYRPSYMLMVILKDSKIPQAYQEKINLKFNDFYQHNFEYDHALANCSGINLDTFRELGWSIKKQGVESYLKGIAAIPYVSLTDNFNNAKKASNYMLTEKTNLYPFVAFTTLYEELAQKITKKQNLTTDFEKELAEQIEAIIYIKTPQYPSSRATGLAPIASFDEYMSRVPENKSDWKIVPVPPRPFPEALKEHNKKQDNIAPYTYAIIANIAILLALVFGISYLIKKFKKGNKNV